jgi:hypothetical protein
VSWRPASVAVHEYVSGNGKIEAGSPDGGSLRLTDLTTNGFPATGPSAGAIITITRRISGRPASSE